MNGNNEATKIERMRATAKAFHETDHGGGRRALRQLESALEAFGVRMAWEWSSPEAKAAGEARRRLAELEANDHRPKLQRFGGTARREPEPLAPMRIGTNKGGAIAIREPIPVGGPIPYRLAEPDEPAPSPRPERKPTLTPKPRVGNRPIRAGLVVIRDDEEGEADDPTPEEIAARAAEIRRGWTVDEAQLRRGRVA